MAEMMDLINTRETLIDEIRKELLGPGSEYSIPDSEHEIITDLPEVRYSVGVLFPQKNLHTADNGDVAVTNSSIGMVDPDEENEFVDLTEDNENIEENKKSYSGSIAEDTDVSTLDEDIGLATQILPSSMGFTFFINKNINKLIFEISFGTYRKTNIADCMLPFKPQDAEHYYLPEVLEQYIEFSKDEGLLKLKTPLTRKDIYRIIETDHIEDGYLIDCLYRLCNQFGRSGFRREPHFFMTEVSFTSSNYNEVKNLENKGAKLSVLFRPYSNRLFAVTVMLVNTNSGGYNGLNSIFQPQIRITTDNNFIDFIQYANREYNRNDDEEEKSLELLYRNKKVYATGHGVSVDWDIDKYGKGKIWTDFMPSNVVPQMDFDLKDKSIKKEILSMKYLSDLDNTSKSEKINSIKLLVDAYSNWISNIEKIGMGLENHYRESAEKHIKYCCESRDRMIRGLNLLETNKNAYNAFLLANRAMFMQRIHSDIQKKDSYPNDYELQRIMASLNYYEYEDKYFWRPFQLAFLLMSIRSIVENDCDERDIVDLIWFPTGGGKTEAYLGLTAFTIFFRRIEFPETSSGTAVIMRYTLRLLAAQQFLRAGTLICACEAIRKDCEKTSKYPVYPLGKDKITIGLWIGGQHTPNKNEEAKKCVEKLSKANVSDIRELKDKYNKFQILKCPWCGTKLVRDIDNKSLIGQWGYNLKDERHFYLACTQENCEFEVKLPIQIVDEELYDNPPTLLFGTVDKFAMLPWKNDVGSFFATDSRSRTPELIIQDELHLISGPLGTIVGLYETAIDALCSSKGIKPKIIASTATIRRAKEQCSSLYNREVRQFPASGIDAGDSFFAREANIDEKPGRLYVGIMPSGKTKAMMEVRSIAAILQRVYMMNVSYDVKDKYWTLTVYFNSLRDLGKCATLIDDDVKDFIRRTAYRFGSRKNLRQIGSADELTSRISTSQLNETLEKLEHLEYTEKNQLEHRYPVNVLLASNMISVGVDVARLNVMLLIGQPKLTSEYIQASSRIGRSYPGVAFVLYDGSKSRDRSHYEQFIAYHESFYRFVEPTGITPFSKPARERALHSIMISFIRHLYGISKDNEVVNFDKDLEGIKEIEEYILNRISKINSRADYPLSDESKEILEEMNIFWNDWQERLERSERKNFYYGDRFIVMPPSGNDKRLIKPFGSGRQDPAKETLTSMRNVDKNVAASILIWGE